MNTVFYQDVTDGAIAACGALIRKGELVAFPTETVYGLGADACNTDAVMRIYEAKGRESDNPLIVHFASPDDVFDYADVFDRALFDTLSRAFMPGPLTLVLPRKGALSARVSAGLSTVAVRVPSHPVARALIAAAGTPIAAPSANRSHRPSPTSSAHVLEDLDGRIAAVLEGGTCRHGVESTVLSLCGELRLLRPGAVTREMIEAATGRDVIVDEGVLSHVADKKQVASPGMKYRHYAPNAPMTALFGTDERVRAAFCEAQRTGAAILCYDEDLPYLSGDTPVLSLGAKNDFDAQAERLFSALRELDRLGVTRIYARLPGEEGLGMAVKNRLIRAAEFDLIEV